jgi:DNA transformation protein and related proteins
MPGTGQVRAQDRAQSSGAEHGELKIRTGIFHRISMPQSHEYLQYVLEQLDSLRGVVSRRMFGGAGLYQDEVFFGLIFRDTLYFKVNEDNRAEYESRRMSRFQPYPDKPYLSFSYYEVPAEVLEDRDELMAWARRSIAAALAIQAEKRAARPRRPEGKPRSAGKRGATRERSPAAKRVGAKKKKRSPSLPRQ